MKTAICVIIKNENDYLDEWLNHHLNIGIDEIYLYEDYGSKSHLDIVKPYSEKVHLFSIDVIFDTNDNNRIGCVKQDKLFNWFPIKYKNLIDWVLFIDVDEFLMLKEPLHNILNEYQESPALLLKWKYYGANGYVKKPIGKVMNNFTHPSPSNLDYYWSHKSFVNLKKYTKWENSIHKVHGGIAPVTEWGEHKAWINHYFTKSWEEWKFKLLSRGDLGINNRKITQFFCINKDMLPLKNDLLLDIAIDNATKLGFNKNKEKGTKYLHFCWFGGNPFNEINKLCIESWKKYLSDNFIVCLWNESSFGVNDYKFTQVAYNEKYWAFVADYVRIWAIYHFGGVYLDTDVELLKPIDNLPTNFFAIEKEYDSIAMGLGYGAEKGNKVMGDLLNIYNTLTFDKNKKFEITSPTLTTEYFYKNGYCKNLIDVHEFLGFTIYPDKYFCPKNHKTQELNITNDTISIHHYHASWV